MSEQLEFPNLSEEEQGGLREQSNEEPVETPTPQTSNYEVVRCKNCEDAGACARCDRGRQWIKDNPIKI